MNSRKEENMHFTLSAIVGMLAQEWYVIYAYFGTYVLLEVRKHGERIAAHRVVRHALWAASFVIVLHAAVVSEALTRRTGFQFAVFVYEVVMCLTGATIYFVGKMFEEVPKTVEVNAEEQP
jgi:ABC-type uncharacterized transport system permease subunit